MQVRRWEDGGGVLGVNGGEETVCLCLPTFADLPSSHRRLLPAGRLREALGRPSVFRAAGRPAWRLCEWQRRPTAAAREEQRQEAEEGGGRPGPGEKGALLSLR